MATPKLKNSDIVTAAGQALEARRDWERKLAYLDLVRFLEDRPKVRNSPWPNASNFAYALADMVIDDWKPQLGGSLMGKERLVNFVGLTEQLVPLAGRAATWYDFKTRNYTNFKREMKFAADPFMHSGMAYIKIVSDEETGLPHYEYIDDLFIIRDRDSQLLEDDGWFIHVLQLDADYVRRRFDGLKGLEKFLSGALDPNMDVDEIDQGHKVEASYKRVGIDRSVGKSTSNDDTKLPKSNILVVWEYHYLVTDKKGKVTRRIRTVSPDDPSFDFADDREYPDGYDGWMVKEGRREFKTKRCYDTRGLTELLAEPQAFLSAIIRTIHNKMTWSASPMVSAPDGLPEGAGQNFTLQPGVLIPFNVAFPQPPPVEGEWFEQVQMMREYGEQRGKQPDFGLKQDPKSSGDSRTLGELEMIKEASQTSASSVLDNWDDFITEVLHEGWRLIVANKDKFKDFAYVSGQGLEKMDVEALSDQYLFTVASSAEILNKKLRLDKLISIHQMGIGKPYYDEASGFKKVIERMEPDLVQELYVEGPTQAASEAQKALLDLQLISQAGGTPQIEEGQDHSIRAKTTAKFLTNKKNVAGLSPDIIGGLVGYGKAQAQMLSQTNPKEGQGAMAFFTGIQHTLENGPQLPAQNGQPAPQGEPNDPHESVSIAFKDLPVSAKIQALKKLGINTVPQDYGEQIQTDLQVEQAKAKTKVQADVAGKVVDHQLGIQNRAIDHSLNLQGKVVDHATSLHSADVTHQHGMQSAEQQAALAPKPSPNGSK